MQGTVAITTMVVIPALIVFLYNFLPLILFVVMFILSMMYKVDSFRDQMNADLAKMHGEAKAE